MPLFRPQTICHLLFYTTKFRPLSDLKLFAALVVTAEFLPLSDPKPFATSVATIKFCPRYHLLFATAELSSLRQVNHLPLSVRYCETLVSFRPQPICHLLFAAAKFCLLSDFNPRHQTHLFSKHQVRSEALNCR